MRKSVALFLRKLADFIDPRVKPGGDVMMVRIEADASQAIASIDALEARLKPLIELLEKAKC